MGIRNYKQRLLWEQECKASGFPMKAEEKHTWTRSKSHNSLVWWDESWNFESFCKRKGWKWKTKKRKQWMK